MFDPAEYFIPGLGAPNTFMSSTKNLLDSRSMSIIARKSFADNGIELKYIGVYSWDGNSSINELGVDYEIFDNLHLLGAINKIKGNNTENNQFSAMEDFSHIRLELKYYY